MMYNEIIGHLREYAEWAKANEWEMPIALSDHLKQAADAIEELLEKLNHADDQIERLVNAAEDRRWIPVAERRAEFPCICYDANGNMPFIPHGIVTIKDDQGVWQIDAGLADPILHQGKIKPVLGYGNRITHWQPLPQPPKEE